MTNQPIELPPEALERLRGLYEEGKCLQAFQFSQKFGTFGSWKNTEARLIAGRLAHHLGASRLAQRLFLRSHLRDRNHPEARYYFNWTVLEFRGPLAAWNWNKKFGEFEDVEPGLRADCFALRARTAFLLRDFQTAEFWLRRADELAANKPWLHLERAYLLEAEDRYDEALLAARKSLDENAWYRPGIQAVAHMLQLLNRDEEAVELLSEASQHLESSSILAQLAIAEIELKRFGDARNTLVRCEAAAPLMEKEFAEWLYASRADVAYYCGNYPEAIEFARKVDKPFYKKFVERLEKSSGKGRHIQLPVGFVRQHHMTCAPATLSAISEFWAKPAEQLSVAEKICYDGTPAHSERSWAEQNGWATREFKVTAESAESLLQRGVVFTLTTVEPGNAHLQAVVGFDELRDCLFVRDPYQRHTRELQIEAGLEHYASNGPRGMAMVPVEKADKLIGLTLPEAELYDRFYRLQQALEKHDRENARREFDLMKTAAPEHRLTLQAQRAMAGYDANLTSQLDAIEKLLVKFPKDVNLQLSRIECLRTLSERGKRVELLKELCDAEESDPLLWREYVSELGQDARQERETNRLLRRVCRARPADSYTTYLQANLLWNQRRFAEATELYRFAASLDDKKEFYARAYFSATRHLKETSKAIEFLTTRVERLGKFSHLPATTLFWAHSEMDQTTLGFQVLEKALVMRPEDGELLLYAADAFARYGNNARADDLLNKAEGRTQKAHWLRTAASLKTYRGERAEALPLWEQVLELEPLALDANRYVAQLLAETRSRAAALDHLEKICRRFPHNFALHNLRYDWLREDGAAIAEPAIRKLIEIDSINAWAHRELALVLGKSRKFAEAFEEAELAIHLDPTNPAAFYVRGFLQQTNGNRIEAKSDFKKALSLSVDFGSSVHALIETCDSLAERKEAIAFIEQELIRQVVFGDGLLAFREVAQPILEPEELLASLRKALNARPDLWHAWSAVFLQLTHMGRSDEALELAREAAERFPLLPRIWTDYAEIHRARLDSAGEIAALEKAVQINSSWSFAVRQLASAFERAGQLERARTILEDCVSRSPLDPFSHGCLADVLWKLGKKENALRQLQRALELDSGYEWGWRAIRDWARELNQPDLPVKIIRDLTKVRGGEARLWLQLARTLDLQKDSAEIFSAIEHAASLDPRSPEVWDARAVVLAEAGRFEEARAACNPPEFDGKPPSRLRARSAWLTMRQGNLSAAISQMKSVLAEDPSLYWAWKELADWHWVNGSHGDAVTAAAKLSRLAPLDPLPLGYSGDMKRRLEDRKGAKADFRRAMNLAPDYLYAGFSLFDLQFDDAEFEAARETLNRLRGHAPDEDLIARRIRIHAQKRERSDALKLLQELCASKRDEGLPMQTAVLALCNASWRKETEKVLAQNLFTPNANVNVGAAWVECRLQMGKRFCLRKLNRLYQSGEIGRRAIIRYVEGLADCYSHYKSRRDAIVPVQCKILLRLILRKHSHWLRAEDWGWGKVGYALVSQKRMKAAAVWLSNWKEHPRAASWMLYNLVVALHSTNQDSKALEVCRHAVRLPYEQGIQESFRIWLAMEEVLAGNTAAATQLCDGLKAETLQGPNKYFHGLTQAILKVQTSPRDQRSVAFKEARRVLQKTFSGINVFDAGKSIRRFYRRSVRRIALDCGSFSAKIWSWSHQINRADVMIFFLLLGIAGAVCKPEFAPLLFIYSIGIFFYLRCKR